MGLTRRKNMKKYRNKRKGGGRDKSNPPPSPRRLSRESTSLLNIFAPSPDGSSLGGPDANVPRYKPRRGSFGYPPLPPPLPHPLSRESTTNLLDFISGQGTWGSSNLSSREGSLGGLSDREKILEIDRMRRIIEELKTLELEAKMKLKILEKSLPENVPRSQTRRASFGYSRNSDDNNLVSNWKDLPY